MGLPQGPETADDFLAGMFHWVGVVQSLGAANGLTIDQLACISKKPERNGGLETPPRRLGSSFEPSKHMIPACRAFRTPLTWHTTSTFPPEEPWL